MRWYNDDLSGRLLSMGGILNRQHPWWDTEQLNRQQETGEIQRVLGMGLGRPQWLWSLREMGL